MKGINRSLSGKQMKRWVLIDREKTELLARLQDGEIEQKHHRATTAKHGVALLTCTLLLQNQSWEGMLDSGAVHDDSIAIFLGLERFRKHKFAHPVDAVVTGLDREVVHFSVG